MQKISGPSISKMQVVALVDTSRVEHSRAIEAGLERALVLGNDDRRLDPREGAALAEAAKRKNAALLPEEKALASFIGELGKAATAVKAPPLQVATPRVKESRLQTKVKLGQVMAYGGPELALAQRLVSLKGKDPKCADTTFALSDLSVDKRGLSGAEKKTLAALDTLFFPTEKTVDVPDDKTYSSTVYDRGGVRIDFCTRAKVSVFGDEPRVEQLSKWVFRAEPGTRVFYREQTRIVPATGELSVWATREKTPAIVTDPGSNGKPQVLCTLQLEATEMEIGTTANTKGYEVNDGEAFSKLDAEPFYKVNIPLGRVGNNTAVLSVGEYGMSVVVAGKTPQLLDLQRTLGEIVDQLGLMPLYKSGSSLLTRNFADWTPVSFNDCVRATLREVDGDYVVQFQSKHDKRRSTVVPVEGLSRPAAR